MKQVVVENVSRETIYIIKEVIMFEMEKTIYRVIYSAIGHSKADNVWPDRFELSAAMDCAKHLAREGRYTKIIRENDKREVWNSIDG